MSDQSDFEGKYFIDGQKYNCPFCSVRGAKYSVVDNTSYNKDDENIVYVYIVECDLCEKQSIHLSDWSWNTSTDYSKRLANPFTNRPRNLSYDKYPEYSKQIEPKLDLFFFYHYPTSFFTIDVRIPKTIRELVSEAENCKKMNFLVGASGALRKAIYKFLKHERAEGKHYEDKIKWLKIKYPNIDADYFDVLASIKDMNDQNLHEEDWEPFGGTEFDELIGATKATLNEIYVEPIVKKRIKEKIFGIKSAREKQTTAETKPQ
jgi:hypothetical protein